jgi:L-malate glycosyltransferase
MMIEKRILIICPFPEGVAAGQRLKYEQYFDSWEENNYKVTISPYMEMHMWEILYRRGYYARKVIGTIRGIFVRFRDIFRVSRYDIVYIFQWITPFGSTWFERLICRLSKTIIYDLEDNAILKMNNDINPFISFLKNPNKIKYLVKNADHVITSSPFLNDYCVKINDKKKCTYVSSSVDTNIFIPVNSYSNNSKIVIGWTGTFSSKQYLDSLRGVFVELSKSREFKLRIIGNFEYEFEEIDLEVIHWSKEDEVRDLQGIDIGIYPLTPSDWVLGKSGLKAIQYMAFGLPVVATNVGTSSKIINHLDNGWLVTSEKEWVEALRVLIDNSFLRKKLGTNARKLIVRKFSTNVIKDQYLSILNSL